MYLYYVCMHACKHACVCVCVCVRMYTYIHNTCGSENISHITAVLGTSGQLPLPAPEDAKHLRYCDMRRQCRLKPPMHTSARQHTSAYVSIRRHAAAVSPEATHAYVSIRQHASAYLVPRS